MIYSKVEHNKTSSEIERQIEALILEGVLNSGDKLPGERELSKSFNVSRPIVRQALAALERRQLLIARHGGGTYVADVIGTVFAAPIVDLIGSNKKAKADYLEYRQEVEGITAAMAAQRATAADKSLLERLMHEMQEAHRTDDPPLEAKLDIEFHSAIGECAHNIILLHTLRSCYQLLSDDIFYNREKIYGGPGARDLLLQQHQVIYGSVVQGDANAASQAAKDHIRYIEQATREVEQKVDWSAISELRLAQRNEAKKPKSSRSKSNPKKSA
jgi:GntR family transcriptional repressor for pyruvate dehydrogenase complex